MPRTCVLAATLLAGCAAHARYGSASVDPLPHPASDIVVVGVLDGRDHGGRGDFAITVPDPRKRDAQFDELSASVGRHLANAGLLPGPDALVAAPTRADDVRELLADAARDGTDEVWFVRLVDHHGEAKQALGVTIVNVVAMATAPFTVGIGIVPLLVVDSLPVNHEEGGSELEVIAVDAASGDVLAIGRGEASYDHHPSAFGLNPGKETVVTMRTSLDRALREVLEAQTAGYPRRAPVDDVAARVLSGSASVASAP